METELVPRHKQRPFKVQMFFIQDNNGSTPLMNACENGSMAIAQLLIESGAKVDDKVYPLWSNLFLCLITSCAFSSA
jgi:ankyrin repeat protein